MRSGFLLAESDAPPDPAKITRPCPTVEHVRKIVGYASATVLITQKDKLLSRNGGDFFKLALDPDEHCRFQARSHCSGFLDADRMHLWTAAHCLNNLNVIETGFSLPDVSETEHACPGDAPFRAVFGLQERQQTSDLIPKESILECDSFRRTNHDTVRIKLKTTEGVPEDVVRFPVATINPDTVDTVPASGTSRFAADVGLVGFGFPHTSQLRMLPKGNIRAEQHCEATVMRSREKGEPLIYVR